MNNLSVLFHFTKSIDNLISILKNEFKPNFCLENIYYGKRNFEMAIPMVCFCDIPLSQIKQHITVYGDYGIGMSKEWAERKQLNPIFYLKRNSHVAVSLDTIKTPQILEIAGVKGKETEFKNGLETIFAFSYIFRNLKNYEGTYLRGTEQKKPIPFYIEREWRYVPPPEIYLTEDESDIATIKDFFLTKKGYEDEVKRKILKSKLSPLSFEPEDIKYIIVRDETEIGSMIDAVRDAKKEKYDPETVKILTSRIITSEQIKNDF